ncbi:MAG: hypothetical protein ACJ8C4_17600 [Gemmataceae bacterium]
MAKIKPSQYSVDQRQLTLALQNLTVAIGRGAAPGQPVPGTALQYLATFAADKKQAHDAFTDRLREELYARDPGKYKNPNPTYQDQVETAVTARIDRAAFNKDVAQKLHEVDPKRYPDPNQQGPGLAGLAASATGYVATAAAAHTARGFIRATSNLANPWLQNEGGYKRGFWSNLGLGMRQALGPFDIFPGENQFDRIRAVEDLEYEKAHAERAGEIGNVRLAAATRGLPIAMRAHTEAGAAEGRQAMWSQINSVSRTGQADALGKIVEANRAAAGANRAVGMVEESAGHLGNQAMKARNGFDRAEILKLQGQQLEQLQGLVAQQTQSRANLMRAQAGPAREQYGASENAQIALAWMSPGERQGALTAREMGRDNFGAIPPPLRALYAQAFPEEAKTSARRYGEQFLPHDMQRTSELAPLLAANEGKVQKIIEDGAKRELDVLQRWIDTRVAEVEQKFRNESRQKVVQGKLG